MSIEVEQVHMKHKTWFTRVSVTKGEETKEFRFISNGQIVKVIPGVFSKLKREGSNKAGNLHFQHSGHEHTFNTREEAFDFCTSA